jgi:hypothetical protein
MRQSYYFSALLASMFLLPALTNADDKYTNNFYTSATFLYWCTYKNIPTSKKDITKLVDIGSARKELTINLDDWLSALAYETNGDKLTIINKSKVVTGGQFHSTLTSTSSTNCDQMKNTNNTSKEN